MDGIQETIACGVLCSISYSDIDQIQEKAELLKQLDRKFEDPEGHYELAKLYQPKSLYSGF